MTTVNTVLQIYFNPDDLEIVIGEVKEKPGFYMGYISRGPRNDHHPFNMLISTTDPIESKESVTKAFEDVLKAAIEHGDKVFTENGLSKALFSNGFETKTEYVEKSAPVLELKDIERILQELREKGVSSTYTKEWNWKDRYPEGVLT